MAADRAAELSEKDVAVVESRWPQAGLACLVEHDSRPRRSRRTRSGCAAALDGIGDGAVAPAARDDKQGRFAQGDAVGFVDEQIVAWGTPRDDAASGCSRGSAKGRELLTLRLRRRRAARRRRGRRPWPRTAWTLETHDGGQPHYWWLIAAGVTATASKPGAAATWLK